MTSVLNINAGRVPRMSSTAAKAPLPVLHTPPSTYLLSGTARVVPLFPPGDLPEHGKGITDSADHQHKAFVVVSVRRGSRMPVICVQNRRKDRQTWSISLSTTETTPSAAA